MSRILMMTPKGQTGWINDYLEYSEFQCECDSPTCDHTLHSPSTSQSFLLTREALDRPIRVTSGFRCQDHNSAVGGEDHSYHKKGMAIDITSSRLDELEDIARHYFDVVIRYDDFIHCHNK